MERYGKLTVVGKSGKLWATRCDCGRLRFVYPSNLTSGNTTSCGCARVSSGSRHHLWKGHEEITGDLWTRMLKGAKQRGFPVEITMAEAWRLFLSQKRKCKLSGVPISFGKKRGPETTASLDRIDSSMGYVSGNVQWLHKTVNIMKMALSESEFIEWCKTIAANNP